jgi:putative hydrolase of the HAD superfamily
VLANAGGAARFAFEEVLGLYRIFDKLLISAEIGMGKPQPEAYRLAVETFGVPADRGIFVDDVEEYVAAAAAIGIHAERHTSNEDTLAWLESMLHA